MSTYADDAVVDPWVVLRRLMAENRALRTERDELTSRLDELELRLLQLPTTTIVSGQEDLTLTREVETPAPRLPDVPHPRAEAVRRSLPDLPDIAALLRPWQRDALAAWEEAGRRGVVEAVTGAGKTFVGISAARDALAAGGRAVVLVPTKELQEQWFRGLVEHLPDVAVGRLGGGRQDELVDCDVLVAIVHSAAARSLRPRPGDVLVADECHRYGAPTFARALEAGFEQRLGLTATYEREDDGVTTFLRPFFGDVVFTLWYDRALTDGVIAPFDIALGAVELTPAEQEQYDDCGERMEKAARNLEWRHGIARQPYDQFMAQVSRVARGERNDPLTIAARAYLGPMSARRALLAESRGKLDALALLEPAVRQAHGALVFTQTKESAETAAGLFEEVGIPAAALYSGLHDDDRRNRMDAFRERAAQLLAAPRVLDEGVDVPEADLAVIVAASRSRRQLVQRLGRVLRPKSDGRPARLVMLYAKGTFEDPTLYDDSPLTAVLPHSRRDGDFALPAHREALLRFLLGEDAELPPAPDTELTLLGTPTASHPVPTPQPVENRTRVPEPAVPATSSDPFLWDEEEALDAERLSRKEAELTAAADSVRAFLKEIGRHALLTAEQEVDLAKRIETGLFAGERLRRADADGMQLSPRLRRDLSWLEWDGMQAKDQMISANLRLVVSLAKRYTRRGMPFLDVIQEGNLGLIRAVEKFDYTQGHKFSTYATWWIKQAIGRGLADQSRTIRIPVHMTEKLHAFSRLVNEARQRGTVVDTPQDMARVVGEDVSEVRLYLDLLRQPWSLDELLDGDRDQTAGIEALVIDDARERGAAEVREAADQALSCLDDRSRRILRMRYGFETGEPMTLEEIGDRFGVTRERIRQIEQKALKKLRTIVTRDLTQRASWPSNARRQSPGVEHPSLIDGYVGAHRDVDGRALGA